MYTQCWVCHEQIAEAFSHDHHARPQAAGGGPADEVTLCAGCHSVTHSAASMLMGKKASMAEDAIKTHYQDPVVIQRAFKLAKLVVEWMRMRNEGLTEAAEVVRVTLHMPAKLRLALKTMSDDCTHGNGRRIGMERYILSILVKHVLQKYPNIQAEIQIPRK